MNTDEWRESLLKRIDSLDTEIKSIKERLTKLETQDAVDEVHRMNVETRLTSIEDTLKWLVRLILGAIILAGISLVLTGGL